MKEWERMLYETYVEDYSKETFIKAYKYNNLYVVHGELDIVCYDSEYNELWDFFARDIFVTQDGSNAIEITEAGIEVKDWLGYSYLIGFDGKCVREIAANKQ